MFYLPRIIWIALNTKSGMAVTTITDAAIDYQRNTDYLTRYILRFMFFPLLITVCDNTSSCCCVRLSRTSKSPFSARQQTSFLNPKLVEKLLKENVETFLGTVQRADCFSLNI